jgi:predicted dehydrogenase
MHEMGSTKSIRSAVIGYGGAFDMGKTHGKQMVDAGMEFVAACDTNADRTAAAQEEWPGIRTYSATEELLADKEVDLVTVILPHNLHADVAVQCAEAGKHVVVEKPMCLSVAEADRMIAAAKANNVMLSVYQNRRWDADFLAKKDIIQKGLIGDIVHIELSIGGFGHPGDWWRSSKEISGGILFDWGAHMVDWTLQLVNSEITGVTGSLWTGAWPGVTNEDHGHMLIKFKNGATATIEVSQLNAMPKNFWRVLGTKGGLQRKSWGDPVEVKVDHQGHVAGFEVRYGESPWGDYYKNLFDHLVNGADLLVKAEQSRRVISVIEAAEQSSKTHQMVVPAYI